MALLGPPPGKGAKIEMLSKVSREGGFVPQCQSFGFLHPFSADFFVENCKKTYFPIFPIHFYNKIPIKQKGGPLGVKPKLPSLQNLDIEFSHSIDLSHKRASGTYLFHIKIVF